MSASETPRTAIIADRLDQLADALTKRQLGEFSMRIPAQPDRDADLVLSEAAGMVRELAAAKAECENYRVWWERDSKSLSVVIGERNTARAVAEDRRAQALTAEAECDALRAALVELVHLEDHDFAGIVVRASEYLEAIETARAALGERAK